MKFNTERRICGTKFGIVTFDFTLPTLGFHGSNKPSMNPGKYGQECIDIRIKAFSLVPNPSSIPLQGCLMNPKIMMISCFVY